jgi:siroheme synthase-like protein
MDVYPVFLTDLKSRRCVVIGGDAEAERKVQGLLTANAAVTVISESLTGNLTLWADEQRITWLPRACQPGDLRGAWLAIATTRDRILAARLKDEAEAHGVLLNVADDVPHSNFVTGSVMRRGSLAIAVSTSGCSPALAARIRQQLEQTFGPEYADFLDLLSDLRQPMAARHPDLEARKAIWSQLLDSEVLDLLRKNQPDQARRVAASLVGPAGGTTGDANADQTDRP